MLNKWSFRPINNSSASNLVNCPESTHNNGGIFYYENIKLKQILSHNKHKIILRKEGA